MTAISIQGLRKEFGSTVALESIDLEIGEGNIFGIVGPDGAGKTTLFRLLTGILRPSAGSAHVFGDDVCEYPEAVKRSIGYMSQRFSLYRDLSVEENIIFFQDMYQVPVEEREERMERLLSFSRLGPFRDRPAGKLSGGMKQKLGLCCALVQTPRVLFLDEPTTGVDPISRRELWSLLYDLWKDGLSIVVSTPYMDEAERCTSLALIRRGKVMTTGSPDDIAAQYPHIMLEITHPQARKKGQELQKLDDIITVHHYGNKLHVAVSERETVGKIKELFSDDSEADVRTVQATLEDMFLHMEARA